MKPTTVQQPAPAPLVVHDVTVKFAGLTALDRVSFEVAPRTIHALIGPNGAGKSTCFNVLTGVYRASSGTIRLGEELLSGKRPHTIAALGIARTFQNLALSPHQTVRENLMVARHRLMRAGLLATGLGLPRARREQRAHRARVEELAELMGIAGLLNAPAGLLAYGDQKRIELTRALCLEPRLLLLDEPVAGMNADETHTMARQISALRDELGISVLLVEHDMGMVMRIADQVTVLDFGRRIASGPPDLVRADPAVIGAYLGTGREETDAAGPVLDDLNPVEAPPALDDDKEWSR